MVHVEVRDGEAIDDALRRFKRQCERNGVLQEIKKREFYISPSMKKKQKLNEAIRKARRKQYKFGPRSS